MNLNIIPEHKWIDYYEALWYIHDVKVHYSNIKTNNFTAFERDVIKMKECEEAFRGIKNQKSTRQHGLNVEIFNMGVPKVLDLGVYYITYSFYEKEHNFHYENGNN